MSQPLIHPTAIISPNAEIAPGVEIGAFSLVHPNSVIEGGTRIGSFCEIGHPSTLSDGSSLIIRQDSLIRSHCVFYEGSSFGMGLTTGHHVTVRERTLAGKNFQIGTKSDLQGHCTIGDYVRLHSNVHIGQKSEIGDFVWMFPDVLLTNDANPPSNDLTGPKIGAFAVISSKATLLPGVKIGEGAVIGAHSLVGIDVDDGMFASGSPAKALCKASALRMKDDPSIRAYPWTTRFRRGYPDNVTAQWSRNDAQ